jgi:hypothetical protein
MPERIHRIAQGIGTGLARLIQNQHQSLELKILP